MPTSDKEAGSVRVPISSRSIEGRDASILFCSFLAFAYADTALRPMSPRCLQQSSTEKRPRLVAAVGCSREQRRAAIPRLCVLQLRCVFYMVLQLGCIRVIAHKEACRTPGFASPLPRPRSLLCALHTSTRVQSTLVTHAPCVRASPAVHMLSCGKTRSHVKCLNGCSSHWPLADSRPARRLHIWHECALQCARRLRCSRGPCVTHTLCMPSTTTTSHHRTQRHYDNDRDDNERHHEEDQEHDERCEQVRVTRASALTRQVACLRTPPRESQAPEQNKSLPTP